MVEGDKYDYTQPSVLQERDGVIGTVKFFDQSRSFGFVTLSPVDGGGDVFLHLKEIAGGKIRVGATVEFDTKFRSNEKDALRAVDVTSVGERQRREVKRLTKEGKMSQSSGIRSFVGVSAMSEVGPKLTAGLTTAAQLSKLSEDARMSESKRKSAEVPQESETTTSKGGDLEGPQGVPKKAKKVKKKVKTGALSFNVDEEEEEDC
mmetsp:Transcript_26636/g.44610  ORF Transcript_26636/g.44610 Transcript_26636/m.44610 type:complete len:205 (-) Transcript_26636:162-776(-)|eukprot:CAMPEP_0198204750 /NCGR_PEP_ID=MMETSP1445-20131203/8215_1 /TAXON_ID=36898 /ORGANISM="Pyramimonas sp., Strain CCMP2087" /LENGTH=204 /DNA_ID=CAMNT_0043876785 /DNA_START=240 /DNA_END=854 /DNA_ORIENTATION=-